MKLGSKECNKALANYKIENELEDLAVRVLTSKDEDVINIPGLEDLDGTQLDELANVISTIRDDLRIEEA